MQAATANLRGGRIVCDSVAGASVRNGGRGVAKSDADFAPLSDAESGAKGRGPEFASNSGAFSASENAQSVPRKGWTYCSAMSQGKKIQVSWLTSVT